MEKLEHRMHDAEKQIDFFVHTALPPVEDVFYEGQIFDAIFIPPAPLTRQSDKPKSQCYRIATQLGI